MNVSKRHCELIYRLLSKYRQEIKAKNRLSSSDYNSIYHINAVLKRIKSLLKDKK